MRVVGALCHGHSAPDVADVFYADSARFLAGGHGVRNDDQRALRLPGKAPRHAPQQDGVQRSVAARAADESIKVC